MRLSVLLGGSTDMSAPVSIKNVEFVLLSKIIRRAMILGDTSDLMVVLVRRSDELLSFFGLI